ncbi:MAG: isochorismatase family protein, partial [Thermomicrobiales bacterium]|nr:isochorismatase family protein [Thermomicrobiales bacterium]
MPIPNATALIVIDVQVGFDHSKWGRRNNPDAEARIAQLIGAWRASERPIFHIQHLSTNPDSPLQPGLPGVEIKDAVKP